VTIDGATLPYTVEAWITADRAAPSDETSYVFHPLLNRSPTLALLHYHADSRGLRLRGCGLDCKVTGPKRAHYDIDLALTTPYVQLTGDGKAPYLGSFRAPIETAVKQAAGQAYRAIVRPVAAMSVKDAAHAVMVEAYMKASGNGTLPAPARMIMYAARPMILELTGRTSFNDAYFTQTLLPDYLNEYPEVTAAWDVVYDARGHFSEPHTGHVAALGTIEVRDYLGLRAGKPGRPRVATSILYPTHGPEYRYNNILFCEKEGFLPLFDAARLADRYDLAVMSSKGMSVTAARQLLDQLCPRVERIFVLHDFDVAGFSIFGTLGTDSRRYEFDHDLSDTIVDIGLRLADVQAMDLQSEIVNVDERPARRYTLAEHGATAEETRFLLPWSDEPCRRIELNAMTAPQLIAFVEAALNDHGVEKVIPDAAVLEAHAR
jgi:hypothetical protein